LKFVTPKSWYLIGRSRDFKFHEIKKVTIHQKDFVLTRLSSGVITAWASRCPHMNSDLSRGKILEDQIICPFHAWKFNAKGECTDIPSEPKSLTCNKSLKTYPVIEKLGLVFLNNSRKPLFELPIFDNFKDKMGLASQPFRVLQKDAPLRLKIPFKMQFFNLII
jgi:phenylpropionate dioxygenase-like ring-hydroxylating dioxygenase large terminal subunit